MTTPKQPTLAMRMAIHSDAQRPFRELAEEFRRLAANSEETQRCFKSPPMNRSAMQWERGVREGEAIAFRRAAQILEEKLNG